MPNKEDAEQQQRADDSARGERGLGVLFLFARVSRRCALQRTPLDYWDYGNNTESAQEAAREDP